MLATRERHERQADGELFASADLGRGASDGNKRRLAVGAVAAVMLGFFAVEALRNAHRTLPTIVAESRHPEHYYARTPLVERMLARQVESRHLYRTSLRPKDVLPPNPGNVWPVFSTEGHRATSHDHQRFLGRSLRPSQNSPGRCQRPGPGRHDPGRRPIPARPPQ